jgi:hypothetical protein
MWEDHFDFHPPITLTPKEKTDHQSFRDRAELIAFLREHGVRLDDPQNPLRFERLLHQDDTNGKGNAGHGELFSVVQWSVLGWFRDDYK